LQLNEIVIGISVQDVFIWPKVVIKADGIAKILEEPFLHIAVAKMDLEDTLGYF